jgi:hypothetical protein
MPNPGNLYPRQNPGEAERIRKRGVVGLVLLGLAAAVAAWFFIGDVNDLYTRSGVDLSNWSDAKSLHQTQGAIVGVLALLCFTIGTLIWKRFRDAAQRHTVPFAPDIIAKDPRPPILLLRSFADDQRIGREERYLEEMCKPAGPFVAIGSPGDELPPLGAARFYVHDHEWKDFAQKLMDDAVMVLLVAGRTEGLAWELQTCRQAVDPRKVVLIIPNDEPAYEIFCERAKTQFNMPLPPYPEPYRKDIGVGYWRAAVMFDQSWNWSAIECFSRPAGWKFAELKYGREAVRRVQLLQILKPIASRLNLKVNEDVGHGSFSTLTAKPLNPVTTLAGYLYKAVPAFGIIGAVIFAVILSIMAKYTPPPPPLPDCPARRGASDDQYLIELARTGRCNPSNGDPLAIRLMQPRSR